jgi:hypothetical protein
LTRPKENGESIIVGGKEVTLGIPGANKYWASVKKDIPLDDAAGVIMALVSPWTRQVKNFLLMRYP